MGWLIREHFQGFALTGRSMAAFECVLSEVAVYRKLNFQKAVNLGRKQSFGVTLQRKR